MSEGLLRAGYGRWVPSWGLWIVKNKKYNKKSVKIIGRHQGMYQCAADLAASS